MKSSGFVEMLLCLILFLCVVILIVETNKLSRIEEKINLIRLDTNGAERHHILEEAYMEALLRQGIEAVKMKKIEDLLLEDK